jgi:type IV secretory pathway VirB3-like protein
MNKGDRIALLTPITILVITAVFAYLTTMLLNTLGSSSIILAWIIGIIAALFFVVLGVFGLILAVVILADCIHRYVVIRERREIERMIRRRQTLPRRTRSIGGAYSYRPRQSKVRQHQSDNNANNGC